MNLELLIFEAFDIANVQIWEGTSLLDLSEDVEENEDNSKGRHAQSQVSVFLGQEDASKQGPEEEATRG